MVAPQPPRDRILLLSLACHRVHPHDIGVKRQRLLPEGPTLHPLMPQHLRQVGTAAQAQLCKVSVMPSARAKPPSLSASLITQQLGTPKGLYNK